MLNNEFYSSGFHPRSDYQHSLLEDFKRLRALFGSPHPFAYMRAMAKTRRYTRTVYPPGWHSR